MNTEPSITEMEKALSVKWPDYHILPVVQLGKFNEQMYYELYENQSDDSPIISEGATPEEAIRNAWQKHCKPEGEQAEREMVDEQSDDERVACKNCGCFVDAHRDPYHRATVCKMFVPVEASLSLTPPACKHDGTWAQVYNGPRFCEGCGKFEHEITPVAAPQEAGTREDVCKYCHDNIRLESGDNVWRDMDESLNEICSFSPTGVHSPVAAPSEGKVERKVSDAASVPAQTVRTEAPSWMSPERQAAWNAGYDAAVRDALPETQAVPATEELDSLTEQENVILCELAYGNPQLEWLPDAAREALEKRLNGAPEGQPTSQPVGEPFHVWWMDKGRILCINRETAEYIWQTALSSHTPTVNNLSAVAGKGEVKRPDPISGDATWQTVWRSRAEWIAYAKSLESKPVETPVSGKDGASLIAAERKRQMEVEVWTPEHDNNHAGGVMAAAASAYTLFACDQLSGEDNYTPNDLIKQAVKRCDEGWPLSHQWWKPNVYNPIRNLVKAGALLAAEIDRIHRTPGGLEKDGAASTAEGSGK